MTILDTDHLTVLKYPENPLCAILASRMRASGETQFLTTVVSAEEQLRGWLAKINEFRQVHQQVVPYDRLLKLIQFFNGFGILPFDARAADEFERLRQQKVRIGTMDLKIASIARMHDALLLSRNLRDFQRVPGLRVENWLDD